MRPFTKRILATGAATAAAIGLLGGTAGATAYSSVSGDPAPDCRDFRPGRGSSDRDLEIVGLTEDNRLICFEEDRPKTARNLPAITGLTGDVRLVGIDYRPANGELIGLGDAGGVYSVSVVDGVATKKSQLDKALSGTVFGVDFNPTVDRLRVVSDVGQNLRVNVDTGATLMDTALNYAPDATALGVVGAAYTNNDADPNTATTLYDVDANLDQVAIQAPPNVGSLNPTGKLGRDTNRYAEADIYSTVRNGTTVDVEGFVVLNVDGRSGLYGLTLFTGKATRFGSFATRNVVIGIAIPLAQR